MGIGLDVFGAERFYGGDHRGVPDLDAMTASAKVAWEWPIVKASLEDG